MSPLSADLAQLNAAIQAAPTNSSARMRRALLRAQAGAGVAELVEDCEGFVRGSFVNHTARLTKAGAQYWRTVRRKESADPENFQRAMTAAYLLIALELQADAALWVSRANVISLCQMDDGEAMWQFIEDATDADEDETPQMWRTMALVFAVLQGLRFAAGLSKRALELEIDAGLWPNWQGDVAARASDRDLVLHEQLAWLDLQVESEPTNVDTLWERADWFERNHRPDNALADFDAAVRLRPDDAKAWEKRGVHRLNREFDEKNPIALAFADFRQASLVRLGAIDAASVDALQEQADGLWREAGTVRADFFRAHACYSLAIEKAPSAQLYLRRAHTMFFPNAGQHERSPTESERAYHDYARALARDETLDEARTRIVDYLKQTQRRPTAHEQIEALLEARAELLDFGVAPAVVGALLGEVERALAVKIVKAQ